MRLVGVEGGVGAAGRAEEGGGRVAGLAGGGADAVGEGEAGEVEGIVGADTGDALDAEGGRGEGGIGPFGAGRIGGRRAAGEDVDVGAGGGEGAEGGAGLEEELVARFGGEAAVVGVVIFAVDERFAEHVFGAFLVGRGEELVGAVVGEAGRDRGLGGEGGFFSRGGAGCVFGEEAEAVGGGGGEAGEVREDGFGGVAGGPPEPRSTGARGRGRGAGAGEAVAIFFEFGLVRYWKR